MLDKHGREILVGDVLKVFHFVAAARRERRFMYKLVVVMYKLVVGHDVLGSTQPAPALKISHLNLSNVGYYYELLNGRQLAEVEIVQGYGADGTWFKDRPKRRAQRTPSPENQTTGG